MEGGRYSIRIVIGIAVVIKSEVMVRFGGMVDAQSAEGVASTRREVEVGNQGLFVMQNRGNP